MLQSLISMAALSVAALAQPHGVYVDGNMLARWARADEAVESRRATQEDVVPSDRFVRYVEGVVDALEGRIICTPPDTDFGQLRAMVRKYVLEHPEHWGGGGNDLVMAALTDTFPCRKTPSTTQ